MKTRTILTIAAAISLVGGVFAEEITLEQAETAVVNWIRLGRDPVGRRKTEVESSRTVVDGATGAAVHVVRLAGGGFVVTAADDTLSPIMVSAEGGDLDTDERNPLWAFLRRDAALALEPSAAPPRRAASERVAGASAEDSDIAEIVAAGARENRAAWDELLGREPHASGTRRAAAAASSSSSDWVSEIKVTNPLTTTKWGQETHNGASLKNHGKLCYNYYTPPITPASTANAAAWGSGANPVEEPSDPEGNRPCGCTATAAAQLMRVQEHGTTSFKHAQSFPNQKVSARFEWGKMVDRPTSDKQCEAIGKLTATIAYKIGSSFGVRETIGYASRLPALFKGTAFDGTKGFGYKSAEYYYSGSSSSSIESSVLQRAVIPNIDAGFPVIFGIRRSESEGHAIVIDGYKFSGSRFSVHANYGWYGGSPNTWYFPPDFRVTTGGRTYNYNVNDEIFYNVFKSNVGSLVTVHVVNESKKPVNGFKWSWSGASALTARDSKKCTRGTVVFFAPAGTYDFTATSGELSGEASVTVGSGSGVNNQIVQIVLRAPDVAPVSVRTSSKRLAAGAKDGASVPISDVQTVTLSCETEGATIYYTLDGSEPDFGEREDAEGNVEPLNPNCRLYTGPFEIAGGTATVRAIAVKDGMANSDETETTFSFQETKSRDKFADARPLAGEFGTATFDNTGCGVETGEPRHSLKNSNPEPASVWASWTAPRDGFFTFHLSGLYADDGTDMDTQLAVYTGSSVSKLTRVASNDDAGAQTLECGDPYSSQYYSSCVSFRATRGVSYKIAMDTYYGAYYPGTLTLAWSEGATDFISPDSSDHSVSGSGERRTVSFESSSGWVLEEYSSWLEPLAESGSDADAFSYVATSNATGTIRSGYLLFRSGEEGWGMLSVTQGTLPWYTDKAAAMAAARAEGKRILLVSGRDTCGNTRATRFASAEDATVKSRIEAGFILWYDNCDTQGGYWTYASGLTGSWYLPFVCTIDPTVPNSYLRRTTGYQSADALLALLGNVAVFDSHGGSPSKTIRYPSSGAALGALPTASRTGYDLSGWYTDEAGGLKISASTIAADGVATYHARWTAKAYTVALNHQNGTGGTASVTATYGSAMPAIATPTRTGYTFGGYFTAADGGGTQYYTATGTSARNWNIDGARTLYAKWIANTYAVTLDQRDGSGGTASVTATYGSAMPAIMRPRRKGYTFGGYWTEPDGSGTQYYTASGASAHNWDKTEATTLYAKWTESVIVLTLDGSTLTIAGDGELSDSSVNDPVILACADEITWIEVGEGVTEIGSDAFSIFPNVTTIALPDTLDAIAPDAFDGCDSLEMLYLPSAFFDVIDQLGIPDTCSVISTDIYNFVTRLYKLCLDREPDHVGLNNWCRRLATGERDGANAAYGFLMSAEMKNRNLSNADFVEVLYNAMMGRPSDAGGKANWVARLDGGVSRAGAVNGFAKSAEFTSICQQYGIVRGTVNAAYLEKRDVNFGVTMFVARLYTKALGRSYDICGLNNWCNRINTSRTPKAAAINAAVGFFHSAEFKNRRLSNAAYVDVLYNTFLGRNPDATGRANWIRKLNGGMSRDAAMAGFYNSAEFNSIMAGYGIR